MRRTLRTILVGVLVFSVTVDSATACRFFSRYGRCYRPCAPVYYEPCYAPVVCYEPCEPCCSSDMSQPAPGESAPTEEPLTMPKSSSPSMPEPATVNKPAELELPPVLTTQPMPGPDDSEPAASMTDEQEQWRPANETPPLPAEPAMPSDDLFGAQPETPPAPAATMPSEEPDNLFGPSSEGQPAETGNDLLGPAPEQPAGSDEGMGPTDDLFGPSTSAAPAGELFGPSLDSSRAPADEGTDSMPAKPDAEPPAEEAAPAEENNEKSADDLFGDFGAILREPGGLASDAMREWVDNTGQYACRGRLMEFQDGHVRLLKDSGRTTTVPLYRLSQGDLEFVHRQASAQRADVFGQTASTSQPQSVN